MPGVPSKAVLVVEPRAARRAAVCKALSARGIPWVEAPSFFQAIAAVGRADFSMLLLAQGRPAAMRGLCRLARKRHPGIRIVVMLHGKLGVSSFAGQLGVEVGVVPANAVPAQVAATVEGLLKVPAPMDYEVLSTAVILLDVQRALAEEEAHQAPDEEVFAAPRPQDAVLLEGTLEGASGAALLMGIFTQEAVGRLLVESGRAQGSYCFERGEPVQWECTCEELLQSLRRAGLLAPGSAPLVCTPGELMAALVEDGVVRKEVLSRHLRDALKEKMRTLVGQRDGGYQFLEAVDFRGRPTLTRVNPFGMILDHHKRSISPDRLLVLGTEFEPRYMHPAAGLATAAPRLRAFVRGTNVATIVTGKYTVQEFCGFTGLDTLMGTLMVMTLMDAQLITVSDKPSGNELGRVALRKVLRHAATG